MSTSPSSGRPKKAPVDASREHADGTTRRPEFPELEGRTPLPEEITGRASGTSEDLVELFVNQSDKHLEDGFNDTSEDASRSDGEEPTVQKRKPRLRADNQELNSRNE